MVGGALHSLPAPATPLIGRQQEATSATHLLLSPDVRQLTLTGPPGIGKTRLALEVARGVVATFEHGAFFVDLAPIRDPALVTFTIAQTLGVQDGGGRQPSELLRNYLREKQLLLVLDNFEQVVMAGPQVADLLEACHRLKVIVTSREPLRLTWEHEFPVPPLGLPDPGRLPALDALREYPAVTLFIERARAVRPDFALNRENAGAVAEVCVRLDGLPLAIELAAARIKLYRPQAMLGRLQHRFSLLSRGARDLPARQQTLRGAIEWSHDLLTASEQALFRRFSVFVGGCGLEAAQEVCDCERDLQIEMLEGLGSLMDKSLLAQKVLSGGEVRFWMLESIREYGSERLAVSREADRMHRQHAAFFLALAERAEPELQRPDQGIWLDRVEMDHDNLRSALQWAQTQQADPEVGLRLVAALREFWILRGYWVEGRRWLDGALSRSTGSRTTWRAKALDAAGLFAAYAGDFERAVALYEESVALFRELGDRRGVGFALNGLATVAWRRKDPKKASALYEQSLALFRELGDTRGIGLVLNNLGRVAQHRNDLQRAVALCEESLALFRTLGSKRDMANALNNLGELARHQGNFQRAASLYEEGLALYRELGSKANIAMTLHNLGYVSQHQRDFRRAAALFAESLVMRRGLGNQTAIPECLLGLAGVAGAQGHHVQAAELFGAAEALVASIATRLDPSDRAEYDRNVAALRAALGEGALSAAWGRGQAMTLEQAIDRALNLAEVRSAAVTEGPAAVRALLRLTRREQEVAALIAQGLTNREIAKKLVVTERTAANHVQHIMNKLGYNARAQIAAWAVAQGLFTLSPT